LRWVYKFLFKALGWTIEIGRPITQKKCILVVAPHTSNWDFLVGLGARAELNFNPRYAAKKELFAWPFGWVFRKLGGYPVGREASTNFVETVVSVFKKEEEFILTITPEGTRSYNEAWKTGFYYIAKEAEIPIIPVAFDYKSKQVVVHEPMRMTEPVEEVIYKLKKWFSQFEGKNAMKGVKKSNHER
jgi:1-acyl-sn-glycerol-3-phosphate acyltransferase